MVSKIKKQKHTTAAKIIVGPIHNNKMVVSKNHEIKEEISKTNETKKVTPKIEIVKEPKIKANKSKSNKSILTIKSVKELIENVGGEEAVSLVKICEKKKKNVTDDEIAKSVNKKVTEIRAVLNKLHFMGIVNYDRQKNQKTGWYTYVWAIKKDRIAEIILGKQEKLLENLMKKKSMEVDYNMFDCKTCGKKFDFEAAININFLCTECGNKLSCQDSEKSQKEMDEKMAEIRSEIAKIKEICC
jgi:transcription initiation factor TFIIE subunit alpha